LALVVVVPVFLVSSITVLRLLSDGDRVQAEVHRAEALDATLLQLQTDEETGLRGYLNNGQRIFLEPFGRSVAEFERDSAELEERLTGLQMADEATVVRDIVSLNVVWRREVVEPVLHVAHPKPNVALALHGKSIVDRERFLVKQVDDALSTRERLAQQETSRRFLIATLLAVAATLLIGGGILVFGLFGNRYEAELERERSLVEKFQKAFISRWDALPGIQLGTAYVSATHEAEIGGDLFDVRRLDADRGYVLIADVSGKGVEAAVDTAFIKFTVRALAQDGGRPGVVLESFNRLVMGSLSNPDAFIVAFLGFFDRTTATLRYSSAGHSQAFLRRGREVSAMRVTGPILGIDPDDAFATETLALAPGDVVVLATDGLTEARDERGTMLGDEGAMQWIAEATTDDPQELADWLVARLRDYVPSHRLGDDLALLVARVDPA